MKSDGPWTRTAWCARTATSAGPTPNCQCAQDSSTCCVLPRLPLACHAPWPPAVSCPRTPSPSIDPCSPTGALSLVRFEKSSSKCISLRDARTVAIIITACNASLIDWDGLLLPSPYPNTHRLPPGLDPVYVFIRKTFHMSVQRGQYVVSKNYVEELHRH